MADSLSNARRDSSLQALDLARAALAAGDVAKADRLVKKAMDLFPSDEARLVARAVRSAAASASASASASAARRPTSPGRSGNLRQRPSTNGSAAASGPSTAEAERAAAATPEQRQVVRFASGENSGALASPFNPLLSLSHSLHPFL